MPYAVADDGVKLYYEETGSGLPLVFVHEFAGDHRSWEPQVRCFARRYRCIGFNARGYPPSDVPEDVARYSQARARDDVAAVLSHLGIDRAHVVGLSMGGFAVLHFGLDLSRKGALARGCRLRLRRRARSAGAVPARVRGDGADVRDPGQREDRRHLWRRAVARPVPQQGPARLAGVPGSARRAQRQGVRR